MNTMNYCDHGHETRGEVRQLRLGASAMAGSLFTCREHYLTEIAFRRDTGWEDVSGFKAFPTWESLRGIDHQGGLE